MTDFTQSLGNRDLFVFFQQLAEAASVPSLAYFRGEMAVENKEADDFDPVTVADRDTEATIRALIEADFPDHGIIGEEYGAVRPDSPFQWVIDPIDGTRAYLSGLPVWGTLVGLLHHGSAIAGMISQPYLNEVFLGAGGVAYFYHGEDMPAPLVTATTTSLSQAKLMTTSPFLYRGGDVDRFAALEKRVQLSRYGCDCYAFAMLASGHVDVVVEPGLQTYDIAGLIAPIEAAGGIVTTWDGGRAENGGNVIAACTPELHAAACSLLTGGD
ncbi:MAG: histidinol-phosphatase [Pseudomonadota bacterium]